VKKIAAHIVTHRWYWLIGIALVTAFFAYHAFQIKMVTKFDDLFPQKHAYIKVHNKFRELFGGANFVSIELRVKRGDIFNTKTLEKIKMITNEIEKVPFIHPYQIVSLARRNVKDMRVSTWGMKNVPVMYPNVPQTPQGLEELKDTVFHNDTIYGPLVSLDAKSTLIQAVFIKDPRTGKEIDYKLVFDKLNEICDKARDENTVIKLSGNPILYGWVYHYFGQMKGIFALTIAIIIALLYFYFRSWIGVIRPLISGTVSAIWGLGLANLLGYNLDPLILVIPFLISARVVSHSVQMVRRYDEAYYEYRDVKKSCIEACAALMAPGLLGIITDALGILVILTAPIPILVKLALMSFYWVMSIIVSVLILDPIILSFLPAPSVEQEKFKEVSAIHHTLGLLGKIPYSRKGQVVVIAITFVVLAIGGYYGRYLKVGDARPGSPILWPDSEYNKATASINEKFPGTNQLFVIVAGDKEDVIQKPESIRLMEDFQRYMEELPEVGGTISLASVTPRVNQSLHYGDPKWAIQSFHDKQYMAMLVFMFSQGCEPGEMDRYMSREGKLANVICYVKDHKGDTIRKVINRAKTFIKEHPSKEVRFELAGGLIGVLAAGNEVIARSEIVSIILAFFVVFLTCAITYRSLFAGLIFVVPLAASNYLTFAYMAYREIGMNVNTLPVSCLGIGLGVDYGIYIVSRIIEEYAKVKDYRQASINALTTAGGAVLFTATTLISGVIFWYFLSSIRFQAEMGLLLALWMLISMLGGMVLIPTIIAIFKPKFIARGAGPGSG